MIKVHYIVKWRTNGSFVVRKGLKRYRSLDEAQNQVERWSAEFPANRYYIEIEVGAILY